MPFINIKVLNGALSKEKKEEMISRVTQLVAEIEARPTPKKTSSPYMVPHRGGRFGRMGRCGKPVTREMLKAALTGKG